jgi:hypothetical protein
MTLLEISRRLREIESSKGDDEIAHSMEDDLIYDFIEYLSNLQQSDIDYRIVDKAQEILKVKDIDFERWYA